MRDPHDEVIIATTARAEEVFDELLDTLVKEDDPIGVACSLLIQLTRFVAEAETIAKELAHDVAWHPAMLFEWMNNSKPQ